MSSESSRPILNIGTTSTFEKLFSIPDPYSPSVSIYKAKPKDGHYPIGHFVASGKDPIPAGIVTTLSVVNDNPDQPLLKNPIGWSCLYTFSDFKLPGNSIIPSWSIWYPIAPDGYVALGFLGNQNSDVGKEPEAPSFYDVYCLRKDHIEEGTLNPSIGQVDWQDPVLNIYTVDGTNVLFADVGSPPFVAVPKGLPTKRPG